MTDEQGYTTRLEGLLDRWNRGDETAIEELIGHSQERLRQMASRMLANKPHVARWHQTDDVLQNALVRFYRALKAVQPASKLDFTRLAATQIRRELIDLARSLYGPEGHARHHRSDPGRADSEGNQQPLDEPENRTDDQFDHLSMVEFHQSVGKLADSDREVFEMIFYQGMSQEEVARLLETSVRTVKRRWRDARLSLSQLLS